MEQKAERYKSLYKEALNDNQNLNKEIFEKELAQLKIENQFFKQFSIDIKRYSQTWEDLQSMMNQILILNRFEPETLEGVSLDQKKTTY